MKILYNKKKITWPLGDTDLIFLCWKHLSLVCFAHTNIKSVSPHSHIISSIYDFPRAILIYAFWKTLVQLISNWSRSRMITYTKRLRVTRSLNILLCNLMRSFLGSKFFYSMEFLVYIATFSDSLSFLPRGTPPGDGLIYIILKISWTNSHNSQLRKKEEIQLL